MSPERCQQIALTEMARWGLTEWTYKVDHNTKRRLGQCDYDEKTISVSLFHIVGSVDHLVIDTILHEIAHALTPYHRHDDVWKEKCRLVGARPRSCKEFGTEGLARVEGKWRADCTCGIVHFMHKSPRGRAPTGYFCRKTKQDLVFRPNVKKPQGPNLFDS